MEKRNELISLFRAMDELPETVRFSKTLEHHEYLLDGEIKQWTGAMQAVHSPVFIKKSTSLEHPRLGAYPLMSADEALLALNAAENAYDHGKGPWPTMGVEKRIHHVEQFIIKMIEKRAEVVRLLMWEICKSLPEAEKEFDRTIDYIRDTVDALKELDRISSRFSIEQNIIAQIRRAPLGVVLCMGPYNYPLNETFTTLIPALLMGNTIVFKPPKLGVLLHYPLLEAFRDAFPKGVINTVFGKGQTVVGPMMASGKIDALAFIGSDRVADQIKRQHPKPHRLRSVLGLGAKNAAIVLEDSDLDLAVNECLLGSLSFNGQRCTAIKIIFVHQQIISLFLEKFCDKVSELKIGLPWDTGVKLTPLPEENQVQRMQAYIDDAVKNGARIQNPGGGEHYETLFFPAVLYPVNSRMSIYHEEQFGPLVPIAPFNHISEPLKYIEESDYGQQVSLFGRDPQQLSELIDPLVNQVCRVNINSQCQRGPDTFPFTGRKDSAEGTLSVSDALRVFSIRTLVAAKGNDQNKEIIRSIVQDDKSNFLSTDFIL